MRIVICPHQMVMGGSQLNAIELAGAMQERGHEVLVYAPAGVLTEFALSLNLEVIESPDSSSRLSLTWMLGLMKIVRSRRVDLIHAYEWGPCVASAFSTHLLQGKPLVMTILSMDVPDFLPTHVPIIVGTQALYRQQAGKRPATLLEPVIDVKINVPQDSQSAKDLWKIRSEEFVVGVVCRLTTDLEKLQGVLRAIEVCGELARTIPIRLIIAGGGEGLDQVSTLAESVNERLRQQVVSVTGNLIDPGSVYACSDVVVGMGSSALKGMAFGKTVIVQGAHGYWKLLTPETAQEFLDNGWYGQNGLGDEDLKTALLLLKKSPQYRVELGRFGRELVERRFGLQAASAELEKLYVKSTIRPKGRFGKFSRSMSKSALKVVKFRSLMRLRVVDAAPGGGSS